MNILMNDLPSFPDFVSLDIKHKEALQTVAEQFPAYSDFNFVSLFSWDTAGRISISNLYDNLVVLFSDYINGKAFLSYIGNNRHEATLDRLFNYCEETNTTPVLRLIGEEVVRGLPPSISKKYTIEEDKDSHDYILSVQDLSEFGPIYHRKKNVYNRFVRNHGHESRCVRLDLSLPHTIKDIEEVLAAWQRSRNKTDEEVKNEFTAIRRCLTIASELNVLAFGTYVNGHLIAFTIFEIVPGQTAMLHFSKANVEFEGVFEHLKHNFAKHLSTMDVKFINYEQDLGIEGMRRDKESYKPVHFLKKYVIKKK